MVVDVVDNEKVRKNLKGWSETWISDEVEGFCTHVRHYDLGDVLRGDYEVPKWL